MMRTLKNIIADVEALNEDARRLQQLGNELCEKRAEIIDNLTETGIRVTVARAMLPKIDCTVTLPDGEVSETAGDGDEGLRAAE